MALFEITPNQINRIAQTTFGHSGIYERGDLQRLLKKQIEVVLPDILIIAEEFGDWDSSRRRIDLLGIDKRANLIVIELKRTEDGGHMELQALRYAAMVSTLTFEKAAEIYSYFLQSEGLEGDARELILEFLEWAEPNEDEFAQDVKIVLISSNFSKELTTAVMWLNKRDLDIKCIRIVPYRDGERTLVDIQEIIPLPEVAEYQVRIREKEQKERSERVGRQIIPKFWQMLLKRGEDRCQLHSRMSPSERPYIGASTGVRGLNFFYVAAQHHSRVELYIDRGDAEINNAVFNELLEHKDEIETVSRLSLDWQGLFGKRACRIAYLMNSGGYRDDESNWPKLQDEMIEAMIRLEKAISAHLPVLKSVR